MKIGLFDVDSKYHNLALMKLSTYHKQQGDEVEFYDPLWSDTYNLVFVSKIFRKPHKNDMHIPTNAIKGGSGFIKNEYLSGEEEHLMPDYSLYNLDYSLGFTTRGCIRDCGFCIVRQKEGYIKEHAEVEEFLNPKSNVVVLLDNNFLALSSHIKKLQKYIDKDWKMDFNQGLDARLVNKENAALLARIKYYRQLRFSWDFMKDEKKIKKGLSLVLEAGIKPRQIMVYVLVGYNTVFDEDMYRFNELRAIGVDPYIMRYDPDRKRSDKNLTRFARWTNRRVYKVCTWEEYDY